jgi:hypothetical protein
MSRGVRNLLASLGAALLLVSGLAATVSGTPLVRSTALRLAGLDPKAMVLRVRDIRGGFRLDQGHYLNIRTEAKSKSVSTARLASWGYLSGYEADYSASRGEIAIITSASVYRTVAGAHAGFAFTAARVASKKPPFAGKVTPISSSVRLGKESQFYAFSLIQSGKTITGYGVSWRSGRVGAALVIAGATTSGRDLATVVSLARKQQTLILHSTR